MAVFYGLKVGCHLYIYLRVQHAKQDRVIFLLHWGLNPDPCYVLGSVVCVMLSFLFYITHNTEIESSLAVSTRGRGG